MCSIAICPRVSYNGTTVIEEIFSHSFYFIVSEKGKIALKFIVRNSFPISETLFESKQLKGINHIFNVGFIHELVLNFREVLDFIVDINRGASRKEFVEDVFLGVNITRRRTISTTHLLIN